MGKKWGSNEDIHVGDIFHCDCVCSSSGRPHYYQVVALRGRTQVVLHAIRSETYTQEGISEDGPMHYHRTRIRPLIGQFMAREDMWEICEFEVRGKRIRVTGEEVTAWVCPERRPDGTPWLLEVGPGGWRLGYCYEPEQPENWEPWDLETAKRLEAERYAEEAALFGKADGQP